MIRAWNFGKDSMVNKALSQTLLEAMKFIFFVNGKTLQIDDSIFVENFCEDYSYSFPIDTMKCFLEKMIRELADEKIHEWCDSFYYEILEHVLDDTNVIFTDQDISYNPNLSSKDIEILKKEIDSFARTSIKELFETEEPDEDDPEFNDAFFHEQSELLLARLTNPSKLIYDFTLDDNAYCIFQGCFVLD